MKEETARNVLGTTTLKTCCMQPLTGYFRTGCCHTDERDHGTHIICAVMTQEFLDYSASLGNDLITPRPQWQFPGLKPGDKWCLCLSRWLEAVKAGKAPQILLEACHERTLQYISITELKKYQL